MMTRKLGFLVPPFLKRFDQHLLLNHPAIWMTRVHFVLFYAAVVIGGIGLISLLPMSPDSRPNIDTEVYIAMIPTLIGLIIWAKYVGKNRPEASFGKKSAGQRLTVQAIFLLCVLVFASIPLIYGQAMAYRAAHSSIAEQNSIWSYNTQVPSYEQAFEQRDWDFQFFLPNPDRGRPMWEEEEYWGYLTVFFLLLFHVWTFFMLFVRMGGKHFLRFLLAGTGGLLAWGMLMGFLAAASGVESAIVLSYFIGMVVLIPSAFTDGYERKWLFWKKTALGMIACMSPTFLLTLGIMGDPSAIGLLILSWAGILLSFVLWNRSFEPRFLALYASPQTD